MFDTRSGFCYISIVPNSNFITVYIKPEDMPRFERATKQAAARGLSRSGLMREAMDLWIAKYGKPTRAKAKNAKRAKAKPKPTRTRAKRSTKRS